MEIRRFTPDDRDTLAAVVQLVNAADRVDAPFEHPWTVDGYTRMLRHGWDGQVPETFAAWEGACLVGLVAVHLPEWDNRHLAWLEVVVHPELRGGGRGSALLEFAEHRARVLGRTSLGIDGWDHPWAHGFATKHGLPCRGTAVKRRQLLAEADRAVVEALRAEAAKHAGAYELLQVRGRTPEELLPAVAEMAAAINDAPTDDLDVEDEVFTVERVVAYETAQEARLKRVYRLVARHRESGELAGHTIVAVDSEQPWIGDQHDTSVVADHRGHRLGLLLKSTMLQWLAEEEPQVATIDTWNMESNAFMIDVNETLGYQVLGRSCDFQRSLQPGLQAG